MNKLEMTKILLIMYFGEKVKILRKSQNFEYKIEIK